MKTVLITGANRGIGLATCKLLRKRKYNIIGVARSKIKNFPGKFIECDLSNENEIELLIKKLKRLNVTCIVNNAGASFGQSIENLDLKQLCFLQSTRYLELDQKNENRFLINSDQ